MSAIAEIRQKLPTLTQQEQLELIELLVGLLRKSVSFDAERMEQQLDAMAADPDIQREIRLINEEFAVADADGLELVG